MGGADPGRGSIECGDEDIELTCDNSNNLGAVTITTPGQKKYMDVS